MTNNNLKQKATSGIIWTGLQKYSVTIIGFIAGIILARLLTPYDYGCIGMLSIFIVIAETFIDGGFGSALIQKKRPTQEDYTTIFIWNFGVAVFLYIVLYYSAPAIARFYNIPLLSSVLRVQGIILFIYAFNIVQRNQLQKKLNFKVLSVVTITSSVIALTVTIIMAYHGFGVWALVALHILNAAVSALFLWFYVKWRPIWAFSWKSFKELFSFGLYVFLVNILNTISGRFQGLLIGKFFNPSIMGYYSKAGRTEYYASNSISSIVQQVAYPLYAEVQDDKNKLGNMIRRLTMILAYLTFPMMFILMLCAKPIFILLYSDRWLESVPYFQILCIAGLAICLQAVNVMSISAIGKSKTMFYWTAVKRLIGIGFVVIGLFSYGMIGLLIGAILNQWFSYFVNICLVSKYIGYKWWKQLWDILPIGLVSVMAAIISYYVGVLCHFPLYIDGLLKFFVYTIVYIGWSLMVKQEAYCYTKNIIAPMISKYVRRTKVLV